MEESLVLAAALFLVAGTVFLVVSADTLSQFLATRGWNASSPNVRLCRAWGLVFVLFGLFLLHKSHVWTGGLPDGPG